MKFRYVSPQRSEIVGQPDPPPAEVGIVELESWRRRLGYLSLFAGVAAVAAVVLGITTLTSEQLTAGETESSSQTGSEFVYFPSQYINQATEPSEHVHAF